MDTISYINLGNGNHPIDAVTVNGVSLTSLCSYYNPANDILYFFKSSEDKNTFIADKTQTNLAIFSTEVSDYIEFLDPNVKSVLASTFGDGTGVTYGRAKRQLSMSSVFQNNTNITVFDEFKYFTGTTSMAYTFQDSSIKKITLPRGVKWTNNGSAFGLIFYGCTRLKEIDFADFTRTSAAFSGQFQLFTNCSALTTLHFDSIQQINNFQKTAYTQSDVPFGYNNSAHKVYIKNDLYEEELLTNLVMPESITEIRASAFFRFNGLTSASLSNVTTVGSYAFYQCTGLTSLDLASVVTINQYAFYGCTRLPSLTIPSTVTTIGQYAFYGCTGLQGDLVVPSSVTSIAKCAFQNCTGLNSLTIPASVTQIATETITGAARNGTVHVCGNVKATQGYQYLSSRHIIIDGNYEGYNTQDVQVQYVESVRIGGNYTHMQGQPFTNYSNPSMFCFFELMGTATNAILSSTGWIWKNQSGGIIHLGYNGIACTPGQLSAQSTAISKIYIGPGESQAGDQAILDLYLANSDWAQYASKLDLWYNYSGIYKT